MNLSTKDYSSGGMVMPDRNYGATTYRFGFNNKENDDDVNGNDSWQDYGMRMYNPRVGRFISVDPLLGTYPHLTPYQFASNSPIQGIDRDGLELQPINSSMYRQKFNGTTTSLGKVNDVYIVEVVAENIPKSYVDQNPRIDVGACGSDVFYNGPLVYTTGAHEPPPAQDEGSDATYETVKRNEKYNFNYVGPEYNRKANNVNGVVGGIEIAEDLAKIAKELPEQFASIKEQEDRNNFYKATNWVNFYADNGELGKAGAESLTHGLGKADLINYVNAGTLPVVLSSGSNTEIENSQRYHDLVKTTGDKILKTNDIPIRTE